MGTSDKVECVRCKTQMESGYVPGVDVTYPGVLGKQQWFAGEPKEAFLGGIKIDRDCLIPVTTFRCPKCGYLESYAKG